MCGTYCTTCMQRYLRLFLGNCILMPCVVISRKNWKSKSANHSELFGSSSSSSLTFNLVGTVRPLSDSVWKLWFSPSFVFLAFALLNVCKKNLNSMKRQIVHSVLVQYGGLCVHSHESREFRISKQRGKSTGLPEG